MTPKAKRVLEALIEHVDTEVGKDRLSQGEAADVLEELEGHCNIAAEAIRGEMKEAGWAR